MSTGNDNFITLDVINEIQDINNGDFLFTVVDGQIYKLDFQNFIVSRNNTDFFTLIDSLSAQVATNTQSLCAINAYLNDNKDEISELLGLSSTFVSLSSNWESTYATTKSLSAQTWLPIPTEDNPFKTGSMIYYDGNVRDWKPINAGTQNNIIIVDPDTGLPVFGAGSSIGAGELLATGQVTVYSAENLVYSNTRNSGDYPYDATVQLATLTDKYTDVIIQTSIIATKLESTTSPKPTLQPTFTSAVQLLNGGSFIGTTLPQGNKNAGGAPLQISANVTGVVNVQKLSGLNTVEIVLNYSIFGTKI